MESDPLRVKSKSAEVQAAISSALSSTAPATTEVPGVGRTLTSTSVPWSGFGIQLARGVSMSLFYEALNRRVPGDFRATVNSLVSLGVRAVFIVTGPLLGYSLDTFGMRTTLLGLAVAFAPLMLLVLVPLMLRIRHERGQHREHRQTSPARGMSRGRFQGCAVSAVFNCTRRRTCCSDIRCT